LVAIGSKHRPPSEGFGAFSVTLYGLISGFILYIRVLLN
jgi:hypothetical protein